MSAVADSKAITTTMTAKASSHKAGANLVSLQNLLTTKLGEAQVLVRQIIALTPSGDANLTALNALLTELL